MKKYFKIARKAAFASGKILMNYFGKKMQLSFKSSEIDFATQADIASEKKIKSIILNAFPEHSILAEESGQTKNNSKFLWVIDPLDGTTNFYHSFPFFAVSIALLKKRKPLLGIVFVPYLKEFFYAIKGKGAFLNNKRIHVSSNADLKKFFVSTGFAYDRRKYFDLNLKNFSFFYKNAHAVRRAGAAAIDLSYVACGRFDAHFEFFLKPWDVAAALLLIKEAHGKITNEKGKPYDLFKDKFILDSNNKKHEELLKLLKTSLR
jgi:myo-inositol-1(or 4)-monophosphatase